MGLFYIMSKISLHTLLLLLCLMLCSCGGDNHDNEKEEEPKVPEIPASVLAKVIAHSIEQNATIDANSTTQLTLVYSESVVINNKYSILLNDRAITNFSINDSIVSIPLSLEPATAYSLSVKSDAFVTTKGNNVAPFLLQFNTIAVVNIGNVKTTLCNNNATTEAKNLYSRLLSQYGEKTMAGIITHNGINNDFANLIHSTTAHYPAIISYDFKDIHKIDYDNISTIQEFHDVGGTVSFGWCWQVPASENDTPNSYTHNENCGFDISQCLIDGTWQYKFIDNDIETIAKVLGQLQDAGIAVLFNPMREAQHHWWSSKGAPYFRELWKMLYDRLVFRHQLNNLIWVWTTSPFDNEGNAYTTQQILEWYPGDDFVDIIGIDIYSDDTSSQSSSFLTINQTFEGKKMLALTECGNIPNPDDCYRHGDTWLFFSAMNSFNADGKLSLDNIYHCNTPTYWKHIMNNDKIITIEP